MVTWKSQGVHRKSQGVLRMDLGSSELQRNTCAVTDVIAVNFSNYRRGKIV